VIYILTIRLIEYLNLERLVSNKQIEIINSITYFNINKFVYN
jgi:hypothetical protein